MSSFEPPRSLPREDVAPPPPSPARSRKPLLAIVLLGLLLAAVGAGVLGGAIGTGPRTGGLTLGPVTFGGEKQTPSGEIVRASAPEGQNRVLIAVDGWSWQSLKDANMQYLISSGTSSGTPLFEDGRPVPDQPAAVAGAEGEALPAGAGDLQGASRLQFVAADAVGTEALGDEAPLLLRDVAARLVSSDVAMKCSKEGCAWSGTKLSSSELSDPSNIPHFGKVYEGYDVGALVYVAAVNVPAGAMFVDVQAEGYRPVRLAVNVKEAAAALEEPLEPASSNGYLQDRYLLAGAFGTLFAPEARWLGQDPPIRALDPEIAPLEGAPPPLPSLSLLQGLGERVESLGLTPSQLTYFSSPTTGCGSALCVPKKASVKIESDTRKALVACAAPGGGGPARAAVSVRDVTLRASFPAPTHQFGAYGKAELGKFPNQRGTALIGGEPPLVEGERHLRFVTVEFYGVGGAKPQLVGAFSRVLEEGVDGEKFAGELPLEETLSRSRFAGSQYAPC